MLICFVCSNAFCLSLESYPRFRPRNSFFFLTKLLPRSILCSMTSGEVVQTSSWPDSFAVVCCCWYMAANTRLLFDLVMKLLSSSFRLFPPPEIKKSLRAVLSQQLFDISRRIHRRLIHTRATSYHCVDRHRRVRRRGYVRGRCPTRQQSDQSFPTSNNIAAELIRFSDLLSRKSNRGHKCSCDQSTEPKYEH